MVIRMRHNPQPQEIYRHFKGNLYQIRCLAKHSETEEMLVIYQAMYGDFQIYARPLASFMEEVDTKKYPNVSARYRFELQGAQGEDLTKQELSVELSPVSGRETEPVQAPEAAAYDEQFETQEELNIDPLVLQFLDADSYERRLEILRMLHNRIDHDMISTMAVAVDVEIGRASCRERV